jgi:hypothetical protein
MGAKSTFLGDIFFLIPPDGLIGAGLHNLVSALGLFRIDQNDTVISLIHRPVLGCFHTRGIITMHARNRQIGYIDYRILSSFPAHDVHPTMLMAGLG